MVSRTGIPATGAVERLTVEAFLDGRTGSHPQVQVESLARAIGPYEVTLSGNGNSWTGCVLVDLKPQQTDLPAFPITATFQRGLS